eukprot:880706-Pyramimonas_sp.AAC.1
MRTRMPEACDQGGVGGQSDHSCAAIAASTPSQQIKPSVSMRDWARAGLCVHRSTPVHPDTWEE